MENQTEAILTTVLDGYEAVDGGLSKKDDETIRMTVMMGLSRALPREIKDLTAFIEWSNNHEKSAMWIAGNLMHDLNGIAHPEPCFSPRTSGYADLNQPYIPK
jgi:hypothetical protein